MSSAASAAAAAAAALAAAAAATGAPVGSVFVKRAGDFEAVFAEVDIYVSDNVARLAERASSKFRWLVGADKVKLFLVPVDSEDAVAAGISGSETFVLTTQPLSSIKALSAVGIRNCSCLLARLSDPPATAPSECMRAARSFFLCTPAGEEGGGGSSSQDVREICRGLRGALTLLRPLPSFPPLQAVAAVAATQQ
jgi:hypothetical protein